MSHELVLFCTTEGFTESYGLPKWPESPPKAITWHTLGDLPGIPAGAFQPTVKYALEVFPTVCGLSFEYTSNSKTANILLRAAPLNTPSFGNPGGVLADSELPINLRSNNAQMLQRYDSERWSSEDFAPTDKISLTTVVRHEICHALGLPHGGSDLMAPTLNRKIAFPGPWTIAELVKRYGKPDVPPAVPPTSDGELVLRIRGRFDSIDIPGYRVTKLDR